MSVPCLAALVRVARLGDPEYPPALASLEDAPAVLHWIGARWPPSARAVAIVGSRAATPYGLEIASLLAADLARAGVLVVSGMARGIDAAAHRGALSAGGETVAVLAAAPETAYPADVARLHANILARGAACAEYSGATPLRRGLFVRRNRIVSGLALGVVVVEAAPGSGALGTARFARAQRRFVAAVPGDITRETSLGTLSLLRRGAVPVAGAGHVLALIESAGKDGGRGSPAISPRVESPGAPVSAGGDADAVRALLGREPRSADEVARRLDWRVERARSALVTLEMAGAATRVPGGRYRTPSEEHA